MEVLLKKELLARCKSTDKAGLDRSSPERAKTSLNSELLMATLNHANDSLLTSPLFSSSETVNLLQLNDTLSYLERSNTGQIDTNTRAPAATDKLEAAANVGEAAALGQQRNPEMVQSKVMGPLLSAYSDDEDEEDRKNLHNRATLDIFLPFPLDSFFRIMEQSKFLSKRSRLHHKRFPITICVSGGAWIIGSQFWSSLVGRFLAARGYLVFCPDYRNFPQTNMEGMVLDVSDAIAWVLRNAERYGGDLEKVTLIGQSAGAHLTMMSLLSQAQLHAQMVAGEPKPSNVAYNVPRYNPRQSIHSYIGLSGIYNVRELVGHLDRRGLYRHVLYQIAGGRANLPRYSLNSYFDERFTADTKEVLPKNIFDFFPQRMFFIHGEKDHSAPSSEAADLVFTMRNAQRTRLKEQLKDRGADAPRQPIPPVVMEYILVPGANHTDAIVEECLSVSTSHLIDFMCYYSTDDVVRGQHLGGPSDPCDVVIIQEENNPTASKLPDGRLYTPAPHKKRPLLIRLGSYVCPF